MASNIAFGGHFCDSFAIVLDYSIHCALANYFIL